MIRKAIYSLWSAPMGNLEVGYNSERAFIESMMLSVHLSRKWFDQVELITDARGKKLIESRGIPFTSVRACLDKEMVGVDHHHWALGKLIACEMQVEPFVHLDADLFWFKAPPVDFLSAPACFQSSEENFLGYDEQAEFCTHWQDRPYWLLPQQHKAYNCGIIGFNNLAVIPQWVEAAKEYVAFLETGNYEYKKYCTGLLFEQFAIAKLLDEYGITPKLLTDYAVAGEVTKHMDDKTAERLGFVHLLFTAKREKQLERAVATKLHQLAPHLYNQVARFYGN